MNTWLRKWWKISCLCVVLSGQINLINIKLDCPVTIRHVWNVSFIDFSKKYYSFTLFQKVHIIL